VRRQKRAFRVTYASAAGASYYRVQIVASDGRHLLYVVRSTSRTHALKLPAIGYKDHLLVSVTGVSPLGRAGRTVHVRA
jgi:hypothetical protein